MPHVECPVWGVAFPEMALQYKQLYLIWWICLVDRWHWYSVAKTLQTFDRRYRPGRSWRSLGHNAEPPTPLARLRKENKFKETVATSQCVLQLTVLKHFCQDPHVLDLAAFVNPEWKANLTYAQTINWIQSRPCSNKAGFKAEDMAALCPILCGPQGLPRWHNLKWNAHKQ